MRLYTGALYVKYNGLMRAIGSTSEYLLGRCAKFCLGNPYTTCASESRTALC